MLQAQCCCTSGTYIQISVTSQIHQSLSIKIGICVPPDWSTGRHVCGTGRFGNTVYGLSNSVYSYLSGMPVSDIIAEVPDPDVREMLEKVCH